MRLLVSVSDLPVEERAKVRYVLSEHGLYAMIEEQYEKMLLAHTQYAPSKPIARDFGGILIGFLSLDANETMDPGEAFRRLGKIYVDNLRKERP